MKYSTSIAAACCALAAAALAQSPSQPPDSLDGEYPVVITPARLLQSLADVPASVSIVTGETLRRYGIRSVPEALRLVPGMAVTHASGPDYRINYHGTNILSPRRMNVLIDGISVYRPAFSEVIWSQLPVVVEDIDRIEVTRGPNSAAYGPNSMLAVVNIITRHPKDVDRAYASVTLGSQSSIDATGRVAFTVGTSSVSVTAQRSRFGGYDALAQDPNGHDSITRRLLDIRSRTALSQTDAVSLHAAIIQGTNEVAFADDFQLSFPDRRYSDAYLGASWTTQLSPEHELRLRLDHARQRDRQSWRTCAPTAVLLPELFNLWRANPTYTVALLAGTLPSGGTPQDDALAAQAAAAIRALGARALLPTCVTPNQDTMQFRTDIELQDTLVVSDSLRFVAGAGARHQGGESQTFLGGRKSSKLRWVFGNVEARPLPWLTLNAGGYYESNSLSPSTFSPRFAANFHVTPAQTLRLVLSRGSRSPDIQEQDTNWSYTFTDLTPPLNGSSVARFYQSRVGPGNLTSERIKSIELGYLANAQRYGLLVDFKVFSDELTSLISERTNLAGSPPTNDGAVKLRGAEGQASIALSPRWSAFANYAYLDNSGATKPLERSQYSRHSGAIGLTHDLGPEWRTSVAYFGASGNGLAESRYGRLDVTVLKAGQVAGMKWEAMIGLRRLENPVVSYANGDTSRLYSRFDDRLQGLAQFSLRLP
jgi:iron complex outermembrane recepter protein